MRNKFRFLIVMCLASLCLVSLRPCSAATTIKKAAPVATKAAAGTEGAASLVPTVIGLVSGVMSMNAQQNALTAECIPSSAEMTFVDNTIKEWAKSGSVSANSVRTVLRRESCGTTDCYTNEVMAIGGASGLAPKYNSFVGPGNDNMVWANFPKTGKGTYCKSGIQNCSGNDLVTMSDTYDLFNLIDFGPADYLPGETTMAAKLLNKVETCTTAKLNAKKKALWGEFLVNTAGSVGKKTNTGSVMDQVGAISGSGGVGAIGSLGSIATQFMNK